MLVIIVSAFVNDDSSVLIVVPAPEGHLPPCPMRARHVLHPQEYAPLIPLGAIDVPEESSLLVIRERPCLAIGEDGGARGNAILAVPFLEAVVVIALNVLEECVALRWHCRAILVVLSPDERRCNDVARGGGRGRWWAGRARCREEVVA